MGKIIEVVPGSPSWHEYRASRLGASQSSIILGINPWQTKMDLYEEKLYGKKVQFNPSMQRGIDLEPIAIKWAENYFHTIFSSKVIEHDDFPWKFATVDGISPDGKTVIEIKHASKKVHEMAKNGECVDYYISQVQSQIACCNVDMAYLISCYPDDEEDRPYAVLEILRDQEYIDDMITKEKEFYEKCMIRMEPPELCDKDYEHVKDNLGFDYHCEAYLDINKQISDLEKMKKEHHEKILMLTKDRNSRSNNFKASKFQVKGSVQYDKIPNLIGVNLDDFRKETREQWRITKNKE